MWQSAIFALSGIILLQKSYRFLAHFQSERRNKMVTQLTSQDVSTTRQTYTWEQYASKGKIPFKKLGILHNKIEALDEFSKAAVYAELRIFHKEFGHLRGNSLTYLVFNKLQFYVLFSRRFFNYRFGYRGGRLFSNQVLLLYTCIYVL